MNEGRLGAWRPRCSALCAVAAIAAVGCESSGAGTPAPTASVGFGELDAPPLPTSTPRKAGADDAIRLIDAVAKVPVWSPASIEDVLGAKLAPTDESTPMLDVHGARLSSGAFESVSLRVPTTQAKTRDVRVVMDVAEGVAVARAELEAPYGAGEVYQVGSPASAAFVSRAYRLKGERLFVVAEPDGMQRVSSVVLCRGACD